MSDQLPAGAVVVTPRIKRDADGEIQHVAWVPRAAKHAIKEAMCADAEYRAVVMPLDAFRALLAQHEDDLWEWRNNGWEAGAESAREGE